MASAGFSARRSAMTRNTSLPASAHEWAASATIEAEPVSTATPGVLSDAEAAIVAHLSFGYSNKEIARLIGMSPDTVKYRLKSVFRKIGVQKRRDAVRVLHERGLIAGDTPAIPE